VFASVLLLLGVVNVRGSLYVTNGSTFGASNAVRLTISVDNKYNLYWNGEYKQGSEYWNNIQYFVLVPVTKCNYQNILAVVAYGDMKTLDAAILEVRYGSQLYQGGKSADIKVAVPSNVNDTQWFMNPYSNPYVWYASSAQPVCNVSAEQTTQQLKYYTAGTRWFWYGTCAACRQGKIYIKLVIPTICNCCC
jgi:hypothetical protein